MVAVWLPSTSIRVQARVGLWGPWLVHTLTFMLMANGLAGMEAGQAPRPLFGEAKVTTPRGDSVRVPFFKSSPLGDTVWVVPLVVFWQVVIQEPIMPKGSWKVEAQVYSTREASPEELAILQRQMYPSASMGDRRDAPEGPTVVERAA